MRRPWLHFLVIGAALYLGQTLLPDARVFVIDGVSPKRVAQIRGEWLRTTGRQPTNGQLQSLIQREADQLLLFEEALRRGWHLTDSVVQRRLIQDMLFIDPEQESIQEELVIAAAIDLGLHRNDLIIKRRLIQRMEQAAYANSERQIPEENELRQLYDDDKSTYLRPATITFDHVYIGKDRYADARTRAAELAAEIQGQSFVEVSHRGDPFAHGQSFTHLNRHQVEQYFGGAFAERLFVPSESGGATPLGPIRSSYGEHLVWIGEIQPLTAKEYSEVRSDILRQWRRKQEQRALNAALVQLRREYEVVQQ